MQSLHSKNFIPLQYSAAFSLTVTCADKHWETLGDVSYSSRNTVRKRIYMNNCCSKTSTFGCSMMPQLSLRASVLEKDSHFYQKQGLGIHKSRLRSCCVQSSSRSSALLPAVPPPSCLPHRFPSAQKERGLSSPHCLCLASGLHGGR